MSLQYARRAAEKLLEGLPHQDRAVDLQLIAQHLRVPVIKEALEANVSGLLIMNGGRATIVVNQTNSEVRQRFSVAHEIGHFVLKHYEQSGDHVHVDKGVRVLQRGLKSTQGVNPAEIEANQFAASLLMPADRVRAKVDRLDGEPIDEDTVEGLAKEFGVSVTAMTIRLSSLGLLE